MDEGSWLDIIDAAYRMDGADDAWLGSVMLAAKPMMSRGLGTVAALYDASAPGAFRPQHFAIADLPPWVTIDTCRMNLEVGEDGAQLVQELFGRVQCALVSDTFARCFPNLLPSTTKDGRLDMLAVNGTDPTLVGCILTAARSDHAPIEPGVHVFWSRLSAHIAAAYRLRRRLRSSSGNMLDSAAAVLSPDARLLHATEPVGGAEMHDLLSETVRVQQQLRQKQHREDPEAVGHWKGMVEARFSLVDHVDSDGKHLILAQANESTSDVELDLSPREREVLAYAALGHSNKMIAYELGLAHSTVRVLLTRAASKLGVRGRDAALARFRALSRTAV